jgi:hypothetical protein
MVRPVGELPRWPSTTAIGLIDGEEAGETRWAGWGGDVKEHQDGLSVEDDQRGLTIAEEKLLLTQSIYNRLWCGTKESGTAW